MVGICRPIRMWNRREIGIVRVLQFKRGLLEPLESKFESGEIELPFEN